MSEDWKRGDLALCVNTDGWAVRGNKSSMAGPKAGQVNEVSAVWMHCFPEGDIEALQFPAWPEGSFASENFVKVTPGHKIEGSEVDQKDPWKVSA